MRANSFVVFIQKINDVDYQIIKSQDIVLDRTFLPKKFHNEENISRPSNKVWLWHIPHGVKEKDVREYLNEKKVDTSTLEIKKLFYPPKISEMKSEKGLISEEDETRQFVGYSIEVLTSSHIKFMDLGVGVRHFWPPGWCSKAYYDSNDIIGDKGTRNFEFSTEPTWIKISINSDSKISTSEIRFFVKSKVIFNSI